jgi:hypothetical protein
MTKLVFGIAVGIPIFLVLAYITFVILLLLLAAIVGTIKAVMDRVTLVSQISKRRSRQVKSRHRSNL